jgi:hypothetical protein
VEPGFDFAEVEADAAGTELEVGHAALEPVVDGASGLAQATGGGILGVESGHGLREVIGGASGQADAGVVGPQIGRENRFPETDTKTDTRGVLERGGRVGGGRLEFLANSGITALSVGVYRPIPTLASICNWFKTS